MDQARWCETVPGARIPAQGCLWATHVDALLEQGLQRSLPRSFSMNQASSYGPSLSSPHSRRVGSGRSVRIDRDRSFSAKLFGCLQARSIGAVRTTVGDPAEEFVVRFNQISVTYNGMPPGDGERRSCCYPPCRGPSSISKAIYGRPANSGCLLMLTLIGPEESQQVVGPLAVGVRAKVLLAVGGIHHATSTWNRQCPKHISEPASAYRTISARLLSTTSGV